MIRTFFGCLSRNRKCHCGNTRTTDILGRTSDAALTGTSTQLDCQYRGELAEDSLELDWEIDRPVTNLPPKLELLLWDIADLERTLQDGPEDSAARRAEAKKLRVGLRKLKSELPADFAKDLDDARAKLDELEAALKKQAKPTAEAPREA